LAKIITTMQERDTTTTLAKKGIQFRPKIQLQLWYNLTSMSVKNTTTMQTKYDFSAGKK
jgi:hypothetical protein